MAVVLRIGKYFHDSDGCALSKDEGSHDDGDDPPPS